MKILIANLIKPKSLAEYPNLSRIGHCGILELKRSFLIVYSKLFVKVLFISAEKLLQMKLWQLTCETGESGGVLVGAQLGATAEVCQALLQKPGVWEVMLKSLNQSNPFVY